MIKNMTTTRSTGVSFIAVLSVLALSACFPGTPAADADSRRIPFGDDRTRAAGNGGGAPARLDRRQHRNFGLGRKVFDT